MTYTETLSHLDPETHPDNSPDRLQEFGASYEPDEPCQICGFVYDFPHTDE